jgi:hypothetical protein
MLFWRENFENGYCHRLFAAPYLELQELSLLSSVKPTENILPLSARGKLSTLRCKNKKKSTRKRNLKANDRLHKM